MELLWIGLGFIGFIIFGILLDKTNPKPKSEKLNYKCPVCHVSSLYKQKVNLNSFYYVGWYCHIYCVNIGCDYSRFNRI